MFKVSKFTMFKVSNLQCCLWSMLNSLPLSTIKSPPPQNVVLCRSWYYIG